MSARRGDPRPAGRSCLLFDIDTGPVPVLAFDLDVEEVAGFAGRDLAHLVGDVVFQIPLFAGGNGFTDVLEFLVSHDPASSLRR
jgi:hypothetical protein